MKRPLSPRLSRLSAAAGALFLVGATLGLAAPTARQDGPIRPDQVFARHKRTGNPVVTQGLVIEASLTQVVVDHGGKEEKHESVFVDRIEWGDVPPAYRDGTAYFDRGDFDLAAVKFKVAAGDADARELVQASARFRSAESFLRWSEKEPAHISEAIEEVTQFLTDAPEHRLVPKARLLQARAKWLAGDAGSASEHYGSLFDELQDDSLSAGYSAVQCLEAGVAAAETSIEKGDPAAARALYARVERSAGSRLASLGSDDPGRPMLSALQDTAILGEGFCALAEGKSREAQTFFAGKLGGKTAVLRHGAALGLGEAYLAEGSKLREAQFQFGRVSALDFTDRDRVARATYRLAEVTRKIGGSDATAQARTWLRDVSENFGDTPWAARAREMLDKL